MSSSIDNLRKLVSSLKPVRRIDWHAAGAAASASDRRLGFVVAGALAFALVSVSWGVGSLSTAVKRGAAADKDRATIAARLIVEPATVAEDEVRRIADNAKRAFPELTVEVQGPKVALLGNDVTHFERWLAASVHVISSGKDLRWIPAAVCAGEGCPKPLQAEFVATRVTFRHADAP